VKEARSQSQIFNRKSISRNTTHRQSYHLIQDDLNHRKKVKTEPRRLISRKPKENLELLFVVICGLRFLAIPP